MTNNRKPARWKSWDVLVDAPADAAWEVTLWGRNLLDEEYYVFGIDIPTLGGFAGVVAPGEVYGVTVCFNN